MPSVSKSQQQFFGMVHQCQKTGDCASDKVKKIAGTISKKDANDFARTKHKGLPKKVKKMKEHKAFDMWLKERDPELHEVATSTADVAIFQRMTIPAVRRNEKDIDSIVFGDDEENKKKAKDK